MSRNTVEIDADVFIDMLWERVDEFRPASGYDNSFWTDCFDYLSEVGFCSDPQYNSPSYIVDNIAVNGEICEIDDCRDNYSEIDEYYDGDVQEWAEDKGYLLFGSCVVINLGL